MWEPFQFFVGSWHGTGEGHSGASLVERTYRFILRDRYLQVTSRSTYPPQEKNPAGEVHEEMGVVSFDKRRGAFVFRQFHGEGFVNQYVAETVADTEIVFATEVIENIAPDWRARETYLLSGPDAFVERFELAAPGKTYDLYSENRFTRDR